MSDADMLRRLESAHYRIIGALYGCETEAIGDLVWTHTPHVPDPEWNHLGRPNVGVHAADGKGVTDVDTPVPGMIATARARGNRDRRRPTIALSSASRPHPYAAALESEGWTVTYRHAWHLHRGVPEPIEAPPAALRIRPVEDAGDLEAFLRVFAAAFASGDPGAASGYGSAIRASMSRPGDVRVTHYLATWDDQPAGTASVVSADGVAGLFNRGVLGAFRRRGIGGALNRRRLADLDGAEVDLVYRLTDGPPEAAPRVAGVQKVVMTTDGWSE